MVVHTVLPSGLADKVGEEDNKLENLVCHFAKLEGHMISRVKIQTLVKKQVSQFAMRCPTKLGELFHTPGRGETTQSFLCSAENWTC